MINNPEFKLVIALFLTTFAVAVLGKFALEYVTPLVLGFSFGVVGVEPPSPHSPVGIATVAPFVLAPMTVFAGYADSLFPRGTKP